MEKTESRNLEELKATSSTADAKRQEYETKLAAFRAEIDALQVERRDLVIGSDRDIEIWLEIDRLQKEIATYADALKMVEKIKAKAVDQLKHQETLAAFDRTSTELVKISSEMGNHMAEFCRLFDLGTAKALEVDQIAAEAMHERSKGVRRGTAGMYERLQSIGSSSAETAESRMRALREAAGIAEFVKTRMVSLRSEIETSLRNRR